MSGTLFDLILGALVLWMAYGSIHSASLLRSVVLYVAFGLLLTLAWLRLHAADLALAEAAVSTALTAVLVLDALAHIRRHARRGGERWEQGEDV